MVQVVSCAAFLEPNWELKRNVNRILKSSSWDILLEYLGTKLYFHSNNNNNNQELIFLCCLQ
jgi:hypothetical protein